MKIRKILAPTDMSELSCVGYGTRWKWPENWVPRLLLTMSSPWVKTGSLATRSMAQS